MSFITERIFSLIKNLIFSKFGFPRPLSGIFWITNKCNSRCIMCGIWHNKKKEEISIKKFDELFSKSKILQNLNSITFAGGEPFLREDLEKFIHATLKFSNPIQIRISTNGFLTERILNFTKYVLRKYKKVNFSIKVSIDGFGKTHDKMRGISNAFVKVIKTVKGLNNIKKIYKNRLHLGISFTVTAKNCKEINKVRKLALKHKWEFFYKPYMKAQLYDNIEKINNKLFVKPKQIKTLIQLNKILFKDLKKQDILTSLVNKNYYKLLIKYLKNPRRLIKCYAGLASFHVTSKGDVVPCQSSNLLMGNIYKQGFDDIWFSKKAKKFRKIIKKSNCHCISSCDTTPSIIVGKFPFY